MMTDKTAPTCHIREYSDNQYGWLGQDIATTCIMAQYSNRSVDDAVLEKYRTDGILSRAELHAIHYMDDAVASEFELDTIKRLATRLGVQITMVEYADEFQ